MMDTEPEPAACGYCASSFCQCLHRTGSRMIMYKAYLTHVQLKQFLASLMEKGLI
jgi:hypothetical protein